MTPSKYITIMALTYSSLFLLNHTDVIPTWLFLRLRLALAANMKGKNWKRKGTEFWYNTLIAKCKKCPDSRGYIIALWLCMPAMTRVVWVPDIVWRCGCLCVWENLPMRLTFGPKQPMLVTLRLVNVGLMAWGSKSPLWIMSWCPVI